MIIYIYITLLYVYTVTLLYCQTRGGPLSYCLICVDIIRDISRVDLPDYQ